LIGFRNRDELFASHLCSGRSKKIKLVWCSIFRKFDRIKYFFLLKRFVAYLKSIWVFKVTCFLIIYIIL
jgi:hypothetical protein